MVSSSWARRLESADRIEDVVALVREYLHSRDPADLAQLPEGLAPPRTLGRDEIAAYAYRLAAHHGHGDDARVTQRLSGVLGRAAVRIAELSARNGRSRAHVGSGAARKELVATPPPPEAEELRRLYLQLASLHMEMVSLNQELKHERDMLRIGPLARAESRVRRAWLWGLKRYGEALTAWRRALPEAHRPARRSRSIRARA